MKNLHSVRTHKIPEIFSEEQSDRVAKENEAINMDMSTEYPSLPAIYNSIDKIEAKRASKAQLYALMEKTAPYLIKNLLYLSNSATIAPRVRLGATKTLIERILPTLSAEHIKLESDDLQSLVIVKAPQKKD